MAVALKQVNEQAIPPHVANPDVEAGLDAVIVKAMQKKTADRYVSADDLRKDLRAVAAGRPVDAGYPGAGYAAAGAGAAAGMTSRMDETAVMPAVGGQQSGGYNAHPENRNAPKRRTVWPWILLAVLLVVAGLGLAWSQGLIGGVKSIPVPDVTSMTRPNAQIALQDVGFTVGSVKEAFSDTAKAGTVVSQSPVPFAAAPKGSAVKLVLSKGPEMIQVPNVIGKPEAEAFKTLEAAGFSPRALPSEFNKDVPANTVYKQTPGGDEKAIKGAIVSYVVSRGTELAVVPDVSGKKQSTAKSTLEKAGFKVAVKDDNSDSVGVGKVISQNPQGAVSVAKGSTVTITISKGPATATVQDVIGMAEEPARVQLESLGFKVTIIYEMHTSSGLVIDQAPKGPTQAALGSTVTLKVDSPLP